MGFYTTINNLVITVDDEQEIHITLSRAKKPNKRGKIDTAKRKLAYLLAFKGKNCNSTQMRAFHYLEKGDIPTPTLMFPELLPLHLEERVAHSYSLITEYYKGKTAKRSGVPYMNHIDEGLDIIRHLRWFGHIPFSIEIEVANIYCLHPIAQDRQPFRSLYSKHVESYARCANAHLSTDTKPSEQIQLSNIHAINYALLVDKLQNYSDLRAYHQNHPRYSELVAYFEGWLQKLKSEGYTYGPE